MHGKSKGLWLETQKSRVGQYFFQIKSFIWLNVAIVCQMIYWMKVFDHVLSQSNTAWNIYGIKDSVWNGKYC